MLTKTQHAARMAVSIMTEYDNWNTDPALRQPRPGDDGPFHIDLGQLPQEQLDLLRRLGTKIGGSGRQFPQFL